MFTLQKDTVIVFLFGRYEVEYNTGKLVSCCGHRLRFPELPRHPPEEFPQVVIGMMECVSSDPQCNR